MRIRTLTTLAATAAAALVGVATTAPSALATSTHDYDNAVLQIKTQSGLAVDVYGAAKYDGAAVVQWTQTFGDNQRWRFVRVDGHHQIRSINSDKCLTVGVRQAAGSPIVQHNCNPYLLSQQWDVEPGGLFSDVLNDLTIRSVSTGLPLTVSGYPAVPGQQLTVNQSRLGDDPGQIFDFTTSVR
jgi:hypothetical protein